MFEELEQDKKNKLLEQTGRHVRENKNKDINLLPFSMRHKTEKKKKSQKISFNGKFHIPKKKKHPQKNSNINIKKTPRSSQKAKVFFWKKFFSWLKPKPKLSSKIDPAIVELGKGHPLVPKSEKPIIENKEKLINLIEKNPQSSKFNQSNHKVSLTPNTKEPQFNSVTPDKKGFSTEDDFEVNLLPKQKKKLSPSQVIATYIIIISFCLTAIITPYLYYKAKNDAYTSSLSNLEKQISIIRNTSAAEQKKILAFGPFAYKLQHLQILFPQHVYWSHFFPSLEKHTSRNLYFISLDVDSDHKVSLSGVAKNLRTAGEQLIVFKDNDQYIDVALDSLKFAEDSSHGSVVEVSYSFYVSPPLARSNTEVK